MNIRSLAALLSLCLAFSCNNTPDPGSSTGTGGTGGSNVGSGSVGGTGSGSGTGGTGGAGNATPKSYTFCAPYSQSGATNREQQRLGAVSSPSGAGSADVTITRNSQGQPTYVRVDLEGYQADYTQTLQYNSQGLLTYFSHDASGYETDFTETFQYNSQGLLTYFNHDASGYETDFTETFQYNSQGLLTYFNHDASSYETDFTETFQYNSQGLLTYWTRSGYGDSDATLSISYDSKGSISTSNYSGASAFNGTVLGCNS